jgi:hypothetical protein
MVEGSVFHHEQYDVLNLFHSRLPVVKPLGKIVQKI